MHDDERCCGSGTCIIDPTGRCWCGQQWDGEKMVAPGLPDSSTSGSGTQGIPGPSASSVDAPVG
ncbi:MAG: hypothetical protein EBT08_03985 [Betaproteobacteria bacterium]|nr:hypothetical protein [Betaproteobacteria bacterium]